MNPKRWKDAATLIIAARNPFQKFNPSKNGAVERETYDYRILTIKRSSKSSFMPESFVFPGGRTDPCDSCEEWLELYRKFDVDVSRFSDLSQEISNPLAEDIFHSHSTGQIHNLISLRISAIRETFEECGLLLCKRHTTDESKSASSWCSYLAGYETKEWQSKVQKKPSEFINACRYFKCYPDIWSLKKWSNWLTPKIFTKRFNTAFFLTTVDQIPPACADNIEITEVQWLAPDEMLRLADAGEITVPIPQLYEMARLQNFQSVERLHHFAVLRDTCPTQRWMSLHVACDDGMIFLLPGDDMYPGQEDLQAGQLVETLAGTVDELRARCQHLNRLESHGTRWRVVSNLHSDLCAGQVYPHPCIPLASL